MAKKWYPVIDILTCQECENCRAVASTSASCEDNCIYAFLFKHFSDSWTCFIFEFFLVSAATHETSMCFSNSTDKSFSC